MAELHSTSEPTTIPIDQMLMRLIVSFLAGIIFTMVVLACAGFVAVETGSVPANADGQPFPLEEWAAKTALNAAIERDTKGLTNPVQPSDDNLIVGVHLYAENCAICHGASDAKPSNLAQGFYIAAPKLAKDGVEDDPEAHSFWKVKHGIRFTAMPSFTTTLKDEDIWRIAMFLKQMDKLPPAVDAEWKKVPSAAGAPPK
jgi:thiosulfate dehydrogenase